MAADEVVEQVYRLTLKKNTPAEIGKILELSEGTIKNIIRDFLPFLKDLDLYSEHKTDVFKGLQKMAVNYLLKKMPNASFKDLTYFFAITEDKINNREGIPSHLVGVGVNIRMEDLVSKKEKVEKKLLQEGVDYHELPTKVAEAVTCKATTLKLPFDQLRGMSPKDQDKHQEDILNCTLF
jgi:hypothetical protein